MRRPAKHNDRGPAHALNADDQTPRRDQPTAVSTSSMTSRIVIGRGLLWAPGRFGVEGVTSIVELLKPHPRSVKAANCLSLDEFEESRSCIFRRYIRPIVTDFLQYSDMLVLGESRNTFAWRRCDPTPSH